MLMEFNLMVELKDTAWYNLVVKNGRQRQKVRLQIFALPLRTMKSWETYFSFLIYKTGLLWELYKVAYIKHSEQCLGIMFAGNMHLMLLWARHVIQYASKPQVHFTCWVICYKIWYEIGSFEAANKR